MKGLLNSDNKRGNVVMIIFFIALLFLILIVAFIMVVGAVVIDFVFDTVVPELSGIGQVGDVNFTEASQYTITPLNTLVQSLTWMTGVLYVLMLVASIGLAVTTTAGNPPPKWVMAFYILLSILLIIGSIFMSNIYEEFYTGNNELASRLHEHVLTSYLILYSPLIFTFIVFITGIIIFSGISSGEESFI